MKKLFLLAVGILCCLTACKKDKIAPQNQGEAFIKYYGHIGDQYVNDMAPTADGGYILIGRSNSYPNAATNAIVDHSYLVKTDSIGNEEWSVTLGPGNLRDTREVGKVVLPLSSGDGYIVGCDRITIQNSREESRIVLYRIDLDGNIVWENQPALTSFRSPNVDGVNEYNLRKAADFVVDIKEAPNGRYVVFGETTSVGVKPDIDVYGASDRLDVLHFLVDDVGQLVAFSDKVRGSVGEDKAVSVEVAGNGNIIIFTSTYEDIASSSGQNLEFTKYVNIAAFNSNLVSDIEEWTRTYAQTGSKLVATGSVLDTLSDQVTTGVTVLGYVEDSTGLEPFAGNIFLIKMQVDLAGEQIGNASSADISYFGASSGNLNGVTQSLVSAGIEVVPPTTQGLSASYIVTANHSSGTGGEAVLAEIAAADTLVWDQVRFFGLSSSQPENTAAKVYPISQQVPGTTLTEVEGFVFTGSFNVGTNTMIGLIKTNELGQLAPRPNPEN